MIYKDDEDVIAPILAAAKDMGPALFSKVTGVGFREARRFCEMAGWKPRKIHLPVDDRIIG